MKTKKKTLLREAWDTETTGLILYGPRATKPFAYSIFDGENDFVIRRLDGWDRSIPEKEITYFKERLATPNPKVFHHLKYDYSVLRQNGFDIKGDLHCTMTMNQMIDNLRPSDGLDEIAYDLAGFHSRADDPVYRAGKESGNYQYIPIKLMHEYQIEDAMRGKLLDDLLWPRISSDPVLLELYNWEIRLILVTADIERNGIYCLKEECLDLIGWLERETHDIQKRTRELTGQFINLRSGPQVAHLLYDVCGFPVLKRTDKAKEPKVDKHVLRELKDNYVKDHPSPIDAEELINLILRYRSYDNGVSTIKSYIKASELDNGIVHTSINPNFDKTGRQASSKPNLHNVAKKKALDNPYPIPARRCFGPRDGWFWDLYDYAQIELRLIILLCKNAEMLSFYKKDPLFDIHTLLGCMWYDIPESKKSDLKKEQRDASKNANFGLPFGAGPEKVAQCLVLPPAIVEPRYQRVHDRFPEYADWSRTMTRVGKRDGYVTTLFGRKLYIPHHLPWAAADYPIQGTAAEILKRAEVKIGEWLKEDTISEKCKLIHNVHDELILEKHRSLRRASGDVVHRKICEFMLDMPEIEIPLVVERERTYTTWNDAETFGSQVTLNDLR
jgi:DNA polymerase-1